MTLVVEDGNGLPDANAYINVAFADDYFTLRGNATWTAADNASKEVAIVKATDYIDVVFGPKFIGVQAFITVPADPVNDQALQFPRDPREWYLGNPDYADVSFVFGVPFENVVASDLTKPVAIPLVLQKACAEYAFRALQNGQLLTDPSVDPTGVALDTVIEKVGPIETSTKYYNIGGIALAQNYPAADLLLKPLLKAGGRVYR